MPVKPHFQQTDLESLSNRMVNLLGPHCCQPCTGKTTLSVWQLPPAPGQGQRPPHSKGGALEKAQTEKLEHKKESWKEQSGTVAGLSAPQDSPAISGTDSLSVESSLRAAALGTVTVRGSLQYLKQDKLQITFNPWLQKLCLLQVYILYFHAGSIFSSLKWLLFSL